MAKDTESHTIRLLQEMRTEINNGFSRVDERLEDMSVRIDGLTHMIVLLSANMGGQEERIDSPETRVDALEAD